MIYIKHHNTDKGTIIALCDQEILGQTIQHNGAKIKISEHFYKGELISSEKARITQEYWQINAFGEKAVQVVTDNIQNSSKSVIDIGGIPHIIIIRV